MFYVLLVFHVMVAIALVVVILLQRSEGGALGMGGGGGGLVSGRAAGNLLTKTTAILGTVFFVNSLALALMGSYGNKAKSILDGAAPVSAPASTAPAAPAEPAAPVAK